MRLKKIIAVFFVMLLMCSCSKEIKNYRIYDELVISFTQAIDDRTLKEEKLTKIEDGRIIKEAQYVYKSNKPTEDSENYLYYLLNNYGAAFLSNDTVAIDSKDLSFAIIIKVTPQEKTFTINISRMDL